MEWKIFAGILALCLLLEGCAARGGETSSQGTAASPSSAVSEPALESSAPSSKAASSQPPTDGHQVTLGGFSLWVPEEVEVDFQAGALYAGEGEDARLMGELSAVEPVEDPQAPFAPYDQRYAEHLTQEEELELGGRPAKRYWLQEEDPSGVTSMWVNTIVYCIQLEDQVVIFQFYPAMGSGGTAPQMETCEAALATLQPG